MNESKIVPFTAYNFGKCLCPQCPVQRNSDCVTKLRKNLRGTLNENAPSHEDIPGLYCSTGKTSCTDLDFDQNCLCGGCPVFGEYALADKLPSVYYCHAGSAGSEGETKNKEEILNP